MVPPIPRFLGDVVSEIKEILRLCKKLDQNPQQRHLLETSWLESLLHQEFEDLERSEAMETLIDGLEVLSNMLEIHQPSI